MTRIREEKDLQFDEIPRSLVYDWVAWLGLPSLSSMWLLQAC